MIKRQMRWLSGVAILAAFITAGRAQVPGQEAETEQRDTGLPTVEDILERHVEAMGGREAIMRHSHRTRIGAVEIPKMNIEGTIRILGSAPNLFLIEADLGEHGVNRAGYNGSVGWTMDEINGPSLLKDAQLAELIRQADFYADLNFPRHYESIEVLGVSKFHEMPTYELKMVDTSNKDVLAYFSIDTGLHVGLKGMMESAEGPIPTETIMADYQTVDGVKVPQRYETHFRDIVQHIRIEKVHHELIDEDVYALPESVAALVEKEKAKVAEPQAEEQVQGDNAAGQ